MTQRLAIAILLVTCLGVAVVRAQEKPPKPKPKELVSKQKGGDPAAGEDQAGEDEESAEQAAPLYEQSPYDQLTLKDKSVINVELLNFPDRRVPINPKPSDKLTVYLVDKPDEGYEVQWRDIVEVKLFEQLVLAEAERLSAAGDMDQAYDYFDFLERNYAELPGLKEAYQRFLYQDAQRWQRQKKYDYVLALLNELWNRNAGFPSLDKALGLVTDKLVEARVAKADYLAARRLLNELAQKYPEEPTIGRWRQKLVALAEAALVKARQAEAAGQVRAASDEARQAVLIWPKLTEARELLAKTHEQYPHLVVGVTQPYLGDDVYAINRWSALRAQRLLEFSLTEFTGLGDEGGIYACPLGAIESQDLGIGVSFRLQPDIHWPNGAPVTGFDVTRTLLDPAPGRSLAQAPWRDLIERVQAQDVFNVDVRLKRAFVHPEALFQTRLVPTATDAATARLGPFALHKRDDASAQYLATSVALNRTPRSPREIVERRYASGRELVDALLRHEVPLIDRLYPWDQHRLQGIDGVVIARYAVPTLHCLLPNLKKPLLANRSFRRALVFGIHRESILKTQILRNRDLNGARVVTGPFPTGYAYNNAVEPRPYEPRVAMMLASMAVQEMPDRKLPGAPAAAPAPRPAQGPTPEGDQPAEPTVQNAVKFPPLVLAHPADEIARLACRTIAKQLALMQAPVKLVELKPGEYQPADGDYDLLYAELQVWDPIVDVLRLFGEGGVVAPISPYLQSALARLESATDWKAARDALLDVHAIVADEACLLPLYQLPELFAYRQTIKNVAAQPATLYQNVLAWQVDVDLPPEE